MKLPTNQAAHQSTQQNEQLVLATIDTLGQDAFGFNIQQHICTERKIFIPLEYIYEILIDLLEAGSIVYEQVECSISTFIRKRFQRVPLTAT